MAAGRGTRLGADRPKALVPLGHGPDAEPLVTHALRGVLSCPDLSDVVVVAPPDRMPQLTAAVRLASRPGSPEAFEGVRGQAVSVRVVPGGEDRTDSVAAGLSALAEGAGIVLIHDAARALAPTEVFERVVAAVRHGHPAVVPALAVTDTIKTVDARDRVVATPERSSLRSVQTPQGFLRETLERAHRQSAGSATDDAGLVEAMGGSVVVVEGDSRSLKITGPEDLAVATSWMPETAARCARSPEKSPHGAPGHQESRHPTRPEGHGASPGPDGERAPVLLVLGGLPGTGKTTVARAWARQRGAVHVRLDTIEQALVRADPGRAVGADGYAAAYALAADQLELGLDVVADSVNPLPVTRQAWRDVAAHHGARVVEVELTCAVTEHRERVETRTADIEGHQVPDWRAVQASDYSPWPDADLCLDTTGADLRHLLAQIEQALTATT
ncbi:2-C-methyl-D-erythritol 4-phosphate cytidylyltransferase [Ornithinimicrobium murale]|uniref:2-C-methyl-D-erythritol 4-phosphate cytidylyltransferase n=1 Tax=Ornithinimicrobium murale TaxID=1050153 RepID=UPI001EE0549C|nr:2-C-methyl-D-erythritol 4-phosphate cytidylyltransferase [Ornithinimicrobium murale]